MNSYDYLRSRYFSLEDQLKEHELVDERLAQAEALLRTTSDQVRKLEKQTKGAELSLEDGEKKLRKAENSSIRKLVSRDKYDIKVEKWREITQEDRKALKYLHEELDTRKRNRSSAQEALERAKKQVAARNQLDKQRKVLLEQAFQGLGGDASEAYWAAERNTLRLVYEESMKRSDEQTKALRHLEKAKEQMAAGHDRLRRALNYNTVDLFSRGRGDLLSLYASAQTNQRVREAKQLHEQAQSSFKDAVEINPDIPDAQAAKINFSAFLSFTNIFIDGLVTDIVVRRKVNKAIHESAMAQKRVNAAYMHQISFCAELKADANQNRLNLDRAEEALERERVRLIHQPVY
eukprot:CAMPEP_0184740594 /NCGR_PEP_ID=MMETSP0315-20130426/3578_1 /TAXON_ID=101924 /ORGANISM="Rhodosorus marinus, Strain UTEX LB 2760" /LENGTH=347 /DNA_ID=CAMNT_0027210325 /DNA_START=99 /DNA_END=1142 /DNA_ORIENTATION=-